MFICLCVCVCLCVSVCAHMHVQELLLSGMPEIDLEDWKSNTNYTCYSADTPVVQVMISLFTIPISLRQTAKIVQQGAEIVKGIDVWC